MLSLYLSDTSVLVTMWCGFHPLPDWLIVRAWKTNEYFNNIDHYMLQFLLNYHLVIIR